MSRTVSSSVIDTVAGVPALAETYTLEDEVVKTGGEQ